MARILVVDDYPLMCRLCQVNLERAGHIVTAVQDGNVAFEILQTLPYDLVISDMIMPVCDGLQLYVKIRGNAETKHLPFLLYGGLSTAFVPGRKPASEMWFPSDPKATFLVAPFRPSDLVMLANQLLNSGEKPNLLTLRSHDAIAA